MGLRGVLNSAGVTNALASGDNVEAFLLALIQAAEEIRNSQMTQTGTRNALKRKKEDE